MLNRKLPERVSRSPSPTSQRQPRHPALAIRTSTTAALQPPQMQQNSPQPERPFPNYPIPIPPAKLLRAVELYKKYALADRLAQSTAGTRAHHGYHLSVPGAPYSASVTSRGSSHRDRSESITASNYEATGSVLSFDGAQSPSSVKQGEMTTFNGKTVRAHIRKKLPPGDREKAALIRYLGACWPCRDRRVPCPLEHHDIDALRNRAHESRPLPHPHRHSRSSHSSSSQSMGLSALPMQRGPSDNMQMSALFGLGANVLQTQPIPSYDTTLDIQTPGGAYGNSQPDMRQPASLIFGASNIPALNPDPYDTYSDGALFPLGVQRGGFFSCQCLTLCDHWSADAEELQNHFEIAHFAFNRITPATRYVCSKCFHFNNYPVGACSNCFIENSIELWIYAKYIRTPSYRRHGPQGGDLPMARGSSSTYYSVPYTYGNFDSQFGSNMDGSMDDGNFDGNITPSNYDMTDGNGFGGPSQGYGYGSFNSPDSGTNQFQGSNFRSAKLFTAHIIFPKLHQVYSHSKTMLAISVILITITFGLTHDYIISHALLALPKVELEVSTHLPILGLVGIVASFTTCISLKHISNLRLQRSKRCPLHALTNHPLGLKLRHNVPDTYLRGGVYS